MTGRLIGIVGPSGVGKDSVMQGVAARRPGCLLGRRVITRAPDAGGEDFEPVSEAEFVARDLAGDFLLSWQAHGLRYGIPRDIGAALESGQDVLVNLSRGVLGQARMRFPGFLCLHLTAPVPVLARRLAERGREQEGEIAGRLARAGFALPPGVAACAVDNSGALEDAVDRVLALLEDWPVREGQ